MSATIIPLEEGWAKIEAGLRRGEAGIFGYVFDGNVDVKIGQLISTDDYAEMYTTMYTTCTQKPPHNWSEDIYNRCRDDAQQVSARAIARLAGKQGDQYAAALFDVCKAYELYTRFAKSVFKYLDRYYVKMLGVLGIREVLAQAFIGALGLEATALSNGDGDRGHDIALLRYMQGHTHMLTEERNGPLEEKWQARCSAQLLSAMLVLCAKDPPRAVLGDDPGRLSVLVRLAREGPFEKDGRSPPMDLILEKLTDQGAPELVQPVEALMERLMRNVGLTLTSADWS